jgi:shikimate kinase
MHRRLFLVGLMGVGKTTVGKSLSDRLGWMYLDNDKRLKAMTGHSPAQIAEGEGGMPALHELEAHLVQELAHEDPPCIASIPASSGDRPAELDTLKSQGVLVYLRMQPETLHARAVARKKDKKRPWRADEVEQQLQEMFAARDDALRHHADLVVDADDLPTTEVVMQITQYLDRQGVTSA